MTIDPGKMVMDHLIGEVKDLRAHIKELEKENKVLQAKYIEAHDASLRFTLQLIQTLSDKHEQEAQRESDDRVPVRFLDGDTVPAMQENLFPNIFNIPRQ